MFETQSASIGELAKALVKAQATMPVAQKSKDNPFFKSKYADLPALIHVSRNCLTDNGLSVSQVMIPIDGQTVMKTILMHTSGEWVASYYPIHPVKNDPQSLGSAVSYARRYSYAPAIGLVTDDAEDDDGNAASASMVSAPSREPQKTPSNSFNPPRHESKMAQHPNAPISATEPIDRLPYVASECVTERQIKRLYAILRGSGWTELQMDQYIEQAFKIKSKTLLSKKQYDHVSNLLENKVPFVDALDLMLEAKAARSQTV